MQGETAERILKTANDLLVERGYSAFSYADIADAVKIRKASIHHHFPTKAGLVVAVLRNHRAAITKGMQALDEGIASPLMRIAAYFKYWEGCIEGESISFCIGALLAAEMPTLPADVQAEVRSHFQMLAEWFERQLESGFSAHDIQLQSSVPDEAQTLIAILHGAMLSARALGNCGVFRTTTEAALKRLTPAKS